MSLSIRLLRAVVCGLVSSNLVASIKIAKGKKNPESPASKRRYFDIALFLREMAQFRWFIVPRIKGRLFEGRKLDSFEDFRRRSASERMAKVAAAAPGPIPRPARSPAERRETIPRVPAKVRRVLAPPAACPPTPRVKTTQTTGAGRGALLRLFESYNLDRREWPKNETITGHSNVTYASHDGASLMSTSVNKLKWINRNHNTRMVKTFLRESFALSFAVVYDRY